MLSPSLLTHKGGWMTKETFEAAVAECGSPCWVVLRSGDELPCNSILQVASDFVIFESKNDQRLVRLVDVESVGAEKQKDKKKKSSKASPPRGDEG
jgi:hypothetical protein